MEKTYYLIWVKNQDGKTLSNFVYKDKLSSIPLKLYADFDDEAEMELTYLSIPELVTEEFELPWPSEDDTVHTQDVYKYLSEPIAFDDEYDALQYVFKLLADMNGIPVFTEAMNIYRQIPLVYNLEPTVPALSVGELITITKRYKEKEVIIYDSFSSKITTYNISDNNLDMEEFFIEYLKERSITNSF
ncbi:hypothetical protein [Bacillus sp. AFS040349]|uniref:hypothetical protein n=1 Tax=Bacillus sp. AFS040349 TaxID=2033502 RepID=UPI000BFEA717|nr:hypothetical protein [Bacillus sp. AFS040349]PGT82203.1 hypothetical protein COD11_15520 [Bacillus sp. AFS040349]